MKRRRITAAAVSVFLMLLVVNLVSVKVCPTAEAANKGPKIFHWKWAQFVPAALMGAARTNLPSIIVLGGISPPGYHWGQKLTIEDVVFSVGKAKEGGN
jgi:hypothetical protein